MQEESTSRPSQCSTAAAVRGNGSSHCVDVDIAMYIVKSVTNVNLQQDTMSETDTDYRLSPSRRLPISIYETMAS
jgi:hypothetical protein